MQAQAAPPLEVRFHRLELNYNWARAIAVVALVALLGVVGWLAVDRFSIPDGQRIVTNVAASWGDTNPALFEATYAEDAVFVNIDGVARNGRAAIGNLRAQARLSGYKAEVAGPIVQSGRTVVAPIHLTWAGGGGWVTSIFELNAAGNVIHHQDYGSYEE